MSIQSDFFVINQENTEKEEESLRILNNFNHRKKNNAKNQIQKYEKFKPKSKNILDKIDSTIITAENKVKLLLSSFLNDLKAENKKEENSNIIIQLKRKKSKALKRKETAKKNSSNILNKEALVSKLKKINTISGNKYYKIDYKKNSIQSLPSFNKIKTSKNSKKLFLNSVHHSKDNLPNLKKKYPKNLDLGNNNILVSNIRKFVKTNRKKSVDIHFPRNEINLMNDGENEQSRYQSYTPKNFKKHAKMKAKFRNSIKTSNKSLLNNSIYSESDLNNIINEKLIKLTGGIYKGNLTNEILKESKERNSYNNSKKSNIIYCSNFSDKAKSESNSPKKDFSVSFINKIDKQENIKNFQSKSIISSGKKKLNLNIRRTFSYFSSKIPVKSIIKKKHTQMNILRNLKEKIKKSIILRPEELNLTDDSNINISQSKIISVDKEKLSKSKINASSSPINNKKNIDNNLSNINQNIDKILNKKFENEDETMDNKINENSDNFSDSENENENQEKKSSCSLGEPEVKKEIIKENFRVLIYKKLVYDSLDDEEVEEENNNYIHPDSLFIKIFDNIVGFLAFSSLIYIPYYLASTESFCKYYKSLGCIFNIITEIVYFFDFIFEFFKGYYNFEELLITNNISIIKKFLQSWFLIDLISTFPTYSYLKMNEPLCLNHIDINPYGEILNNLHYLILLNKLMKIFKFSLINHNFTRIFNKLGSNSPVFIQLIILFSLLHFFSCLHIFFSRNSYPNWIIESQLENAKFLDLYISSIYALLASLTTVGYGDIVCHSLTERSFQIFLLIVGSIAYSWLVSSFSNYIQKSNEKYIDFENRKHILDEIKYNHPKMPNRLYEKVLRYLKYKNCNEKKDKNMIFDCLPIGLKNNLVYEMYKPIIKKFIFFKNFGNTDFIVRVILAFRPILAYKNDILLNEGDFVDDILFVKKGILSVQVPINIKNPEEYINKYLYGDILEPKNQQNNFLNSENQIVFGQKNNNFLSSVILQQKCNQMNLLNLNEKEDLFNKMKKKEEENERIKNTRYIKILSIRENEHFGDVLMFLDQRSPLRVKVTSKKAELFFLKKMDVVKISSSYQNIWRRINKKSVFNFEQIKNSIPKIVELYCRFKGFIVNKLDTQSTQSISSKKSLNKNTMQPSSKLKMKTLTIKNPKRNLTQQNTIEKIYTDKYSTNKDDLSNEYKNIKTGVIINMHKNFVYNSDNNNDDYEPDEEKENSETSDNINNSTALLNKNLGGNFDRQYKYYNGYKVFGESYRSFASTIREESERTDSSIMPFKSSNIIKNKLSEIVKNSAISNNDNIKKNLGKSHFGRTRSISEKILENTCPEQNEKDLKEKKINIEIINENNEIFRKRSESIRQDTEIVNRKNSNIVEEELSVSEKQNGSDKNSINDEFDINEEIKIPANENLLVKNISKPILLEKNDIILMQKINNINEQNSEKILHSDKLLNQNSNKIGMELDKNNFQINSNKLSNYKKIFENENLIPDSVISGIQIRSIYNNLHCIDNKYHLNKDLQETVKQLLEEDAEVNCVSSKIIKKSRSIRMIKSENKFLYKSLNNTLNNNSTNNIFTNLPKNNNRVSFSILPTTCINKNRFKQRISNFCGQRSSTFSKLEDQNANSNYSSEILKKKRKKYETNIGDSSTGKPTLIKQNTNRIAASKQQNYNISRASSMSNRFVGKQNLNSLNKYKNTIMRSPYLFNKKKKQNLLSTINLNIEKNSQNINNPDAFYSSYFQSLLQIEKKSTGRFRMSPVDCNLKFRRNKK